MAEGFLYTPDRSMCYTIAPSYEKIRERRVPLIEHLRSVHESNLMFHKSVYGNRLPKILVYVAVNKNNNKLYVGVTKNGLLKRSRDHFSSALRRDSKTIFSSAIRRHGKDSFEFLVFCICKDYNKALEMEVESIGAILPEYNMTSGGDGNQGRLIPSVDWRPSNDELEKIRSNYHPSLVEPREQLRANKSIETRAKMSKARSLWWKSKKEDKDYLDKYSAKKKAASTPLGGWAKSKKVVCITDNNKIIESINAASRLYGISSKTVSRSCKRKGSRKTGLNRPRFVYLDDIV